MPGQPSAGDLSELRPAEILQQLESITTSTLFSKSKRYPNFLRYIVEHSLAGRTDLLKERTLGVEVFHRPSDYDTNADPVVRITAGEIRKRLAQYYQVPGREHELRVDLPLGSYAPLFSKPSSEATSSQHLSEPRESNAAQSDIIAAAEAVVATAPVVEPNLNGTTREKGVRQAARRLAFRFTAVVLVLIAAMAGAVYALQLAWSRAHERGIAAFWNPVLHAENPALIVVGVHSFGPDGRDQSPTLSEDGKQSMLSAMTSRNMLPVSDVASYSELTDLLVRHEHRYRTQSSAETTFSQLQPGPVILLGGLDNAWTMRLTAPLRFHFGTRSLADGAIEDAQHPETVWRFNNAQSSRSSSQDYALVASFYDSQIEQRVLIAAGIGMSGTAAAASFLSSNRYLQGWVSQNHVPPGANIELVLLTQIVDGQQGPPRVVAGYSW